MGHGLIISIVFSAVSFWAPPAISQALERGIPSCSSEKVAAARDGAERNLPASIYMLARYYSTGKCLPGDGVEAIRLYHRAADLDYPPAYYNLGVIEAANQDYGAAEASWLRGAELGHRGCELMLGILYSWPQLAVGDDVKSYAWLSLAAAPGGAGLSGLDDALKKVTARLTPADRSKAQEYFVAIRSRYRAVPAFRP
jgi:TPR repeat protein